MPVFNMLEFLKMKKGLKGIFNIFGEEGAGRDVVGNGKRRFFRRKGRLRTDRMQAGGMRILLRGEGKGGGCKTGQTLPVGAWRGLTRFTQKNERFNRDDTRFFVGEMPGGGLERAYTLHGLQKKFECFI